MTNIPILEGFGCRLRPVEIGDAAFIANLRNQPFAKGMIHTTSASVRNQESWIATWQGKENDYYWIIETCGKTAKRIGTIGFYDIDVDMKEGMPGRWVMLPQKTVNIMAPFLLLYGFVFETLRINRVVMDVVATNKKVCRFHELYGAKYIDAPTRYGGVENEVGVPMVWFAFSKDQWPEMRNYWGTVLEAY